MVILYFALGTDMDMYVQAHLSMLSFESHLREGDRIAVVTTNPEYFRHRGGVEAIVVDDAKVEEWKGKHHFFWRAKIKAMELACQRYPDSDLLYLDCDTFLHGDLSELKRRMGTQGFMDGNEGHPSTIKYKPRRMWRTVAGHTYAGITLTERHNMWCAGVVGIPSARKQEVVSTALALCDGMLDDGAEPIVVEQYALSVAMAEKVGLESSKPYIAHYWGNKPDWLDLGRRLFLQSLFCNADSREERALFDALPLRDTPLRVVRHSTNAKLKRWVDRLVPDGEKTYLG